MDQRPITTRHRRTAAAGFGLVEACAAIAVAAIAATLAMPNLQALLDARRVEGAATELGTDLQLARSEAVARNQPVRLSLQKTPEGACYLIHTGDAADCSCAGPGPAVCGGSATAIKRGRALSIDGLALAWNSPSLTFDPLHGTCTPTATLRVIGRLGREVDHVVNLLGRVRSCSPNAAIGAYRAC